jgi:tetratricopeptide (TPR) repeat protein
MRDGENLRSRLYKRNRNLFCIIIAYQIFFLTGLQNLHSPLFGEADAATVTQGSHTPKIAVIDIGGKVPEESVRKNIVTALRNAFAAGARVKPVSENAINGFIVTRQGGDKQSKQDAIKKAFKLLRDGKEAYAGMRINEAIERLSLAKKELVANLNELKSNDALLDSYLYLGMCYSALGKPDEAFGEFKKVLYLDSKKNLSSRDFPPETIKNFEKARQEIDSLPRGTVIIDTTPSNCSIFINAKEIGLTPINMTLPVGEYYVKAEKEGHLDWYQLISVEDKVNNIDIELAPISGDSDLVIALKPCAGQDALDQPSRQILAEVGTRLSADIVFLGWIERDIRDKIVGQLFDTRTGKLSYAVQASMGKNFSNVDNGVQKLVNDLSDMIDSRGQVIAMEEVRTTPNIPLGQQAPPIIPAAPPIQKQSSFKKNWWIWLLVGGIAAGATIGIVAGMSSGGGGVNIKVDNSGNF